VYFCSANSLPQVNFPANIFLKYGCLNEGGRRNAHNLSALRERICTSSEATFLIFVKMQSIKNENPLTFHEHLSRLVLSEELSELFDAAIKEGNSTEAIIKIRSFVSETNSTKETRLRYFFDCIKDFVKKSSLNANVESILIYSFFNDYYISVMDLIFENRQVPIHVLPLFLLSESIIDYCEVSQEFYFSLICTKGKTFANADFFASIPPLEIEKGDNKKKAYVIQKTYIFKDEISGLYKIGKSIIPSRRSSVILPYIPKLIIVLEIDYDCEKFLHNKFKSKRKDGEWFELTESDCDFIAELTQALL
jgi:hypothetical protein